MKTRTNDKCPMTPRQLTTCVPFPSSSPPKPGRPVPSVPSPSRLPAPSKSAAQQLQRVAIVGAGIAGLTAALSLVRTAGVDGSHIDVFEPREGLDVGEGAGLNLNSGAAILSKEYGLSLAGAGDAVAVHATRAYSTLSSATLHDDLSHSHLRQPSRVSQSSSIPHFSPTPSSSRSQQLNTCFHIPYHKNQQEEDQDQENQQHQQQNHLSSDDAALFDIDLSTRFAHTYLGRHDGSAHVVTLLRESLQRELHGAVVALGVTIHWGAQHAVRSVTEGRRLVFADGRQSPVGYDLVIGADGVRSAVRSVVVGPRRRHLRKPRYTGVRVAWLITPRTEINAVEGGIAKKGEMRQLIADGGTVVSYAVSDQLDMIAYLYRERRDERRRGTRRAENVAFGMGADPDGEERGEGEVEQEEVEGEEGPTHDTRGRRVGMGFGIGIGRKLRAPGHDHDATLKRKTGKTDAQPSSEQEQAQQSEEEKEKNAVPLNVNARQRYEESEEDSDSDDSHHRHSEEEEDDNRHAPIDEDDERERREAIVERMQKANVPRSVWTKFRTPGAGSRFIESAVYDHGILSRWSRNRVVLIGDAAHAMAPFMGQGANQTIQDAHVLALKLALHESVDEALAAYEQTFKRDVRAVVKKSRVLGYVLTQGGVSGFLLRKALHTVTKKTGMLEKEIVQAFQPRFL